MKQQIIIVGGGPAGMMAALTAARQGAKVALWERNERLGRKLALTGKGRCNITNDAPLEELIRQMPGNGRFLYSAFSRFSAQDTINFFRDDLNLPLKTERGRRVFPLSDSAPQVVDALQKELHRQGVKVHFNRRAWQLKVQNNQVCGLCDTKGVEEAAQTVIIATGGLTYPATGSTGDGYRLAGQVGHSLIEPQPSLVGLETVENWPAGLSGLSLKNVRLSVYQADKQLGAEFGELLFTHFGLSGPIMLSLSRLITTLPEQGAGVILKIDLKPALTPEQLDERLLRDLQTASRKQLQNALDGLLPAALWPVVLQLSGLDPNKRANQISRADRDRLVLLLKGLPLTVAKPRSMAEAIVTAGGINVREVNPKTMASRLCEGLYLVGELLDIDGFTGGYNLQAAWSSGYLAGMAAAQQIIR